MKTAPTALIQCYAPGLHLAVVFCQVLNLLFKPPLKGPLCLPQVGGFVEEASPAARLSLWHALVDGCRRALHQTEEERQDAKVRVWGPWIQPCISGAWSAYVIC